MIKASILAVAFLSLAACGGDAPRPTRADAPSFSIVLEQADPTTGGTNIVIKFPKSTLPQQVKAAAESLIASRRAEYRQVTVKSFLEGMDFDGAPLAVSRIENGAVNTVFNAASGGSAGGSVRIPTH